jgi:hypothetical protein
VVGRRLAGARRLRRAAAAAALGCAGLIAAPAAGAQEPAPPADLPSLGAARVGAQVALGVPAGAVGYVAGGLATRWVARRFGATDGEASQLAGKGAYAGIALFTAVPPALIGARGPGRGRYVAAVGGAAVGELASALAVRVGRRRFGDRGGEERRCSAACRLLGGAVFVLPSAGATLGYNLSRRR